MPAYVRGPQPSQLGPSGSSVGSGQPQMRFFLFGLLAGKEKARRQAELFPQYPPRRTGKEIVTAMYK